MPHLGHQDMTPLSLETLCFNNIIRRQKKKPFLVAPLMTQWLKLMNIAAAPMFQTHYLFGG